MEWPIVILKSKIEMLKVLSAYDIRLIQAGNIIEKLKYEKPVKNYDSEQIFRMTGHNNHGQKQNASESNKI